LGAILPLADHWSTRGDASWRRAPGGGPTRPLCIGGMLQWRNSRPRRARSALGRSRRRTPSSSALGLSVISIVVGLVVLSAEERTLLFIYCRDHQVAECVRCAGRFHLREVASLDSFGVRSHGCPRCHTDLTDRIRAHLYGCAMLPVAMRRRAQAAREAARSLVKQSHQLRDAAGVAVREAEDALHALRETMRQSPIRRVG
jgi:hypothetical protein